MWCVLCARASCLRGVLREKPRRTTRRGPARWRCARERSRLSDERVLRAAATRGAVSIERAARRARAAAAERRRALATKESRPQRRTRASAAREKSGGAIQLSNGAPTAAGILCLCTLPPARSLAHSRSLPSRSLPFDPTLAPPRSLSPNPAVPTNTSARRRRRPYRRRWRPSRRRAWRWRTRCRSSAERGRQSHGAQKPPCSPTASHAACSSPPRSGA